MLSSRVNNLVQVYSFCEHSSSSCLVTSSDPTLLDLSIDGPGRITDIIIEPMQREGLIADVDFFQLFVTHSDLSVHEATVYTRISMMDDSTENDQVVADFTRSTIRRPGSFTTKSHAVNKDNGWVIPDVMVAAELSNLNVATRSPGEHQSSNNATLPDTRDNILLGEILSQAKSEMEEFGAIDAVAVMDQVNELLATGADLPPLPLGTL
jgi:RNA polymerase I-specific transcription initiation factor RRN6